MKQLVNLIAAIIALSFYGCTKGDGTGTPTKTTTTGNTKLGGLVKVQTSADGFYTFSITEYSGVDQSSVFHKDTTIFITPYTFQFHPHIGNTVHVELDWREINRHLTTSIHFYYEGVEDTDFITGTASINPPFDYYKSLNYVVK